MKTLSSPKFVKGAAVLAGGMAFAGTSNANPLFSEDFEGVTLEPYTSDTETPSGTGADWSPDLPAGWTRDNTTTPDTGVPEFFGWTVHNKDSWNGTAGQGRDAFTNATGNVLVADGDEYDDTTEGVPSDEFNIFAQTPVINLGGYDLNTLELSFDSSFWSYGSSTASVAVSFDGGTSFETVFEYDSALIGNSVNFSNENIVLDAATLNPTGTDMVVRLGYTEADNDWWWAVDNVEVSAVPEPSSLALLGFGGLALLRRRK